MILEELAATRRNLATAKTALRLAEDEYHVSKAICEAGIIADAAGVPIGKNAEDRDRYLTNELHSENWPVYTAALQQLRDAQGAVDRLQAELDCHLDARRELDRASRDRLTAVLERLAIQQESDETIEDAIARTVANGTAAEVVQPVHFKVGDIVAFRASPDTYGRVTSVQDGVPEEHVTVAFRTFIFPLETKDFITGLASEFVLITGAR